MSWSECHLQLTALSTQGCPRAEEDRMGRYTLTFMEPQGVDRKKIEKGHTSLRSRGTSRTEPSHLSFLAVVQTGTGHMAAAAEDI